MKYHNQKQLGQEKVSLAHRLEPIIEESQVELQPVACSGGVCFLPFSVLQAGCLTVPVWSCSPAEFLENCSSVCVNPEVLALTLAEVLINTAQQQGSEREGKQAKCKVFFFHVYVGCHHEVWPKFRVGLPASNKLIKKISHRYSQ